MTDDPTPEQNSRATERVHNENSAYMAGMTGVVMKDAAFAIRTLIAINGAAAIAILTFVGGVATKPEHAPFKIVKIAQGLRWFVLGVCVATVIAGLSYLANNGYWEATRQSRRDNKLPYVHLRPTGQSFQNFGTWLQYTALILAAISLGMFAIGAWTVSKAIGHL